MCEMNERGQISYSGSPQIISMYIFPRKEYYRFSDTGSKCLLYWYSFFDPSRDRGEIFFAGIFPSYSYVPHFIFVLDNRTYIAYRDNSFD